MAQLPRGGVIKPFEGYPAYGAVHAVRPNEQLRGFMFDASRICDFVIRHALAGVKVEPIEFTGMHKTETFRLAGRVEKQTGDYDSRSYYRIFDSDTLGVTVVEMDASEKAARSIRAVWESQDFGAVEQEVRDQLGESGLERLQLILNRVDTVGKRLPGTQYDVRQKLALFPEGHRSQETIEVLEREADELSSAIRRRLKQYMRPWDMTPHITFELLRMPVSADTVETIVDSMNNYLARQPVGVALDPVAFRHKSVRSKSRK